VSAARDRLAGSFHFSMPSHGTMQMLLDKLSFQRAAEELKCPIPRSLRLRADTDMQALGGMRFPCVVKPLVRDPAYGRRFAKAYKVASASEAAELWREMRNVVREVIMQEWIDGEDSDVYFCLQYRGPHNATPVSFVGRKICQWPPLVGGTASCAPAPDARDELLALTDAFFAALGFVGLCSMEYKRDRRDGKFYMVEPTVGRTDYQEEIAALNGVNIPLAAYLGELGLAPAPLVRVEPPHAWRDPIAERRAHRAGATATIARLAPKAIVDDAYLRFDDPMPYILMKCEPLTRRFARIRLGDKAAQPA
jgi:predicted ATP-grasp superfamily ATP-dependent carboligase